MYNRGWDEAFAIDRYNVFIECMAITIMNQFTLHYWQSYAYVLYIGDFDIEICKESLVHLILFKSAHVTVET